MVRGCLKHTGHLAVVTRETYCLDDNTSDLVRVGVRGRAPVLKVTLLLNRDSTVDTDRGATVCDTPRELVIRGSLMTTSHAELVVLAINGHVLLMPGGKLVHRGFDGLKTTLSAHLVGADVGVKTSAVPVTGDRLGGECDLDAEVLSDAVKEESGHPQLVADCSQVRLNKFFLVREDGKLTLDADTRTNLVLPLGRHNLSVGTGNLNTSVQACLVVRLDDVTAEDLASAHTALFVKPKSAFNSWCGKG